MQGQAEKAVRKLQFFIVDFFKVPLAHQEEHQIAFIWGEGSKVELSYLTFFFGMCVGGASFQLFIAVIGIDPKYVSLYYISYHLRHRIFSVFPLMIVMACPWIYWASESQGSSLEISNSKQ